MAIGPEEGDHLGITHQSRLRTYRGTCCCTRFYLDRLWKELPQVTAVIPQNGVTEMVRRLNFTVVWRIL
jgi:hypothetical protein